MPSVESLVSRSVPGKALKWRVFSALTRMHVRIESVSTQQTPESLAAGIRGEPGLVVLRTGQFDVQSARFSFVAARPMLTFQSLGTACEISGPDTSRRRQFGNPWEILRTWLEKFELLEETEQAFPLGGVFGYWGFELKQFVEPRLSRRAINDLELPDCHLGFHASLVVFDHVDRETWVVATGLGADGTRTEARAQAQFEWWRERLARPLSVHSPPSPPSPWLGSPVDSCHSSLSRPAFLAAVHRAQAYIRAGDIYQVNLAQRLAWPGAGDAWDLFRRLARTSPAPFSAFYNAGSFSLVSSSPELFLRLRGPEIVTRPIKGTRPRSADVNQDQLWRDELQASAKERSELVMITDLLRNDLGRVCRYGSVHVPDLFRLEQFPQVQHLVSTVVGQLRPEITHLDALAACFPGGSITGAPKIRALEIIDELEPVTRGPYCGCHGYLGFNRESQLSITIRTAVVRDHDAWFHVGAGIVADSLPEAEYEETLAKARGLLAALAELPRDQAEHSNEPGDGGVEHESLAPLTDADP